MSKITIEIDYVNMAQEIKVIKDRLQKIENMLDMAVIYKKENDRIKDGGNNETAIS